MKKEKEFHGNYMQGHNQVNYKDSAKAFLFCVIAILVLTFFIIIN